MKCLLWIQEKMRKRVMIPFRIICLFANLSLVPSIHFDLPSKVSLCFKVTLFNLWIWFILDKKVLFILLLIICYFLCDLARHAFSMAKNAEFSWQWLWSCKEWGLVLEVTKKLYENSQYDLVCKQKTWSIMKSGFENVLFS